MLTEYLDNYLTQERRRQVESHLSACEACQAELDSLRTTVELLHRVPQAAVPRAFTIAELRPAPRPVVFGALRTATIVCALLLIFLLLGDFMQLFPPGVRGKGDLMTREQRQEQLSAGKEVSPLSPMATPAPVPAPTPRGALPEAEQVAPPGTAAPEAPLPRVSGEQGYTWPMLQIELALSGVTAILAVMTAVIWWRRKGGDRGQGKSV